MRWNGQFDGIQAQRFVLCSFSQLIDGALAAVGSDLLSGAVANRIDIIPARSNADFDAARRLFAAYAATLPVSLDYQDFSQELAELPGKYAPPAGAILLAREDHGEVLGCVGIRPLAVEGSCEMKRLFALPAARGAGLGCALAEAAIGKAREFGYTKLKLDTLPTMAAAIGLYERLGFKPCASYYSPTPPGTLFFSLQLQDDEAPRRG